MLLGKEFLLTGLLVAAFAIVMLLTVLLFDALLTEFVVRGNTGISNLAVGRATCNYISGGRNKRC